jgi:hypothetical protein
MNCQDVQKFAYTYLDCEFDARERGEFETHLRMCPPCAAAIERDAIFRDLVRAHLDDAKPCAGLKLRVQARIAREHRRNVSRSLAIPLALAACGALAFAGWRWSASAEDAAEEAETALAVAEASTSAEVAANSQPTANSVAARTDPGASPAARLAEAARSADEDELAAAAGLRARAMAALARQLAEGRNDGSQPLAGLGNSGISLASTHAVAEAAMQGEVLRGGLRPDALRDRSPFGAIRSETSLRAMAAVHIAGLAPEVTGSAVRIQRYLASRVPGIGPLPVSEGAGVDLTGARIALLGAQPVVAYMYMAYGVPVTVFSRSKAPASPEDPEVEALAPDASVEPGVLADQRAGLNLVHVVAADRVMTMVSELGAPALLQLTPHSTWL